MLHEGLEYLLLNAPAITAILGTPATRPDQKTTGIFPGMIPKGSSLPAIVYTYIHNQSLMTLDGPDPYHEARLQFSCYAKKYNDARSLARTLAQILEDFTGMLIEGTVVFNMQAVTDMDAFQEAPFLFSTPIDVLIQYSDVSTTSQGSGWSVPSSGGGSDMLNFAPPEVPSGTINGTNGSDGNALFTISHTPNPSSSLPLFKNGLRMMLWDGTDGDYTLSGNRITYLAPAIPVTGDTHTTGEYRY
jgi:hypothetical protein